MADRSVFGIPAAKRVRREELYASRSQSPSEQDAELEAALQRQLDNLFGATVTTDTHSSTELGASQNDVETNDIHESDEGFEFRLFSAPLAPTQKPEGLFEESGIASAPRVLLENDEDILLGDGAFIKPNRDQAYYFSGPASDEKRREFELSAISGEDVRNWLDVRYPAWEKPWKIRILRAVNKKATTGVMAPFKITDQIVIPEKQELKRKQPGKKRRIALRQKHKEDLEAEQKQAREAEAKEAAERDKKTRTNRAKKLRKKAKEKAMKAASGSVGEDAMMNAPDDSHSDAD